MVAANPRVGTESGLQANSRHEGPFGGPHRVYGSANPDSAHGSEGETGVSHVALGTSYVCVVRDGGVLCRGQDAAGQQMRGDGFSGETGSRSFGMAELPFADGEEAARLVVGQGNVPISCFGWQRPRAPRIGSIGVGSFGKNGTWSECFSSTNS